jgi:uncharacterized damage-inducible protein DinB
MMRRGVVFCSLFIFVGMIGVETAGADCRVAEALRTHWARTRRMITNIVAAMPEDKYDYRPVPEVRSFREMAVHLIQDGISHTSWITGMSRDEADKLGEKYANYKSREEILQGLGEMFDMGDKFIASITDENMYDTVVGMRSEPMTRVETALVAFEDQMGHYGNMVVYLRINGVVPPSTANAAQEREENRQKLEEMGIGQPAAPEHSH